jgi:lipid-binding SYLF domain-containing protein
MSTVSVTRGEPSMFYTRLGAGLLALVLAIGMTASARPAVAASAAEINRDVDKALKDLYAKDPSAKQLTARAKGVLVFPSIIKAGFLFGAQYGDGALRQGGRTTGYYNTVSASYGLQAGVQVYGYALFFMTDSALEYLNKSDGFELGVGPSIVVLDEGAAKALTTTTLQKDMYAIFFDQKGLMGGLGVQGTKISRIQK